MREHVRVRRLVADLAALRRTVAAALWAALLVSVATADTVLLPTGPVECEVVALDSCHARLRLPSGGIMMVYTDSTRGIWVGDSARAEALARKAPQVRVVVGAAPALPPQALRPEAPRPVAAGPALGALLAEAGGGVVTGVAGGGVMGGVAVGVGRLILARERGSFWFREFGYGYDIAILGVGVGIGYPLGAAIGTHLAGKATDEHGRFWAALAGSYAGALVGGGAALIAQKTWALALPLVLSPAGAVVGYNLNRPGLAARGSFLDRLDMPAIAARPGGRGQTPMRVDVKLLGVRF